MVAYNCNKACPLHRGNKVIRNDPLQRLSRKLQQANFRYWVSGSDGKSVECKVGCIVLHRDIWDLILAETCDRLSGNCDLDSMKLFGLPVYVEADNDAVWKKGAREFLHQYDRVLISIKSDAEFDLVVLSNWMFRHIRMSPTFLADKQERMAFGPRQFPIIYPTRSTLPTAF